MSTPLTHVATQPHHTALRSGILVTLGFITASLGAACGSQSGSGGSSVGGGDATASTKASTTKAATATKAATTVSATVDNSSSASGTMLGCNAPKTAPSNGACVVPMTATTTSSSTGAGSVASAGTGTGSTAGVGSSGAGSGSSSGTGVAVVECNPVTNEPCAPDYACDLAEMGFVCFPPPNNQPLCAMCDLESNYCQAGFTCATENICMRYCCTDADCGDVPCTTTLNGEPAFPQAPGLGLCVVPL